MLTNTNLLNIIKEQVGTLLVGSNQCKYGENDFRPQNCIETVEMNEYGGLEIIYTDKAFSWAVYFSHEDTVAFAGSIVPQIKELLSKEKEHWNKFEWNLE